MIIPASGDNAYKVQTAQTDLPVIGWLIDDDGTVTPITPRGIEENATLAFDAIYVLDADGNIEPRRQRAA